MVSDLTGLMKVEGSGAEVRGKALVGSVGLCPPQRWTLFCLIEFKGSNYLLTLFY